MNLKKRLPEEEKKENRNMDSRLRRSHKKMTIAQEHRQAS